MTWRTLKKSQLLKFARPQKNGAKVRRTLRISVSFFLLLFSHFFIFCEKKEVDGYAFAAGGYDGKNEEYLSKIERFNGKKWETLKIEIPKKLRGICAILKDDTLHFVGGVNEKREKTDWHFQIDLKRIYLKNGAFKIFENWFRKSGFKRYTKNIGKIVDEYAGNLIELRRE
ncbi:MAG: hypothetical protein GY714_23955 [Desulfobacterales bacterium]|nr:hypothetical protein [Desulfobacterales bacterium]